MTKKDYIKAAHIVANISKTGWDDYMKASFSDWLTRQFVEMFSENPRFDPVKFRDKIEKLK